MNPNRDFHKTVGKLVDAYMNDELRHGDCHACAVGNLLGTPHWSVLFSTIDICGYPIQAKRSIDWVFVNVCSRISTQAFLAIDNSGYSINELAKIEFAFESCHIKGGDMFDSLMAVVDVLADIHGIDLTEREEAKKLFVKS